MKLSILIPAYNVEDTINAVVTDAYAIGQKNAQTLEIIVIDDGSTDQTNKILRTLAVRIRNLKIINHNRNMGYGQTIKQLYVAGSNEWLFTLPGDNQYDAKELLALLPATKTADMILGLRRIRNDSPWRCFQSNIYNRLLNVLFGLTLHDVNTIRLMKKSVISSVTLTSTSAFVDAELAIRAKRAGFRITEIPITHKERTQKGATGGNVLKTVIPTIIDMVRMALS